MVLELGLVLVLGLIRMLRKLPASPEALASAAARAPGHFLSVGPAHAASVLCPKLARWACLASAPGQVPSTDSASLRRCWRLWLGRLRRREARLGRQGRQGRCGAS